MNALKTTIAAGVVVGALGVAGSAIMLNPELHNVPESRVSAPSPESQPTQPLGHSVLEKRLKERFQK
jgi:hypothetical protein